MFTTKTGQQQQVKILFILLVLLFTVITACYGASPSKTNSGDDPSVTQIKATKDLINRLFSEEKHRQWFTLEWLRHDEDPMDIFELETKEQENGIVTQVILRGNSGVALASALNHYLKYYTYCQVTWGANNLKMPDSPVAVPKKVRISTPYKYRYYLNTCTHGYSAVWWDWKRWEREIDWMALNGLNNPLMFTGQEHLWQLVYKQLGIASLDDFFSGPAFLPWNRMANVDGYAGPLPQSWIRSQFELALLILKRMRSFGMKPILPAFAGHVPYSLKTIYPKASIAQLAPWNGFKGTYYLDPMDPLFTKIGSLFIDVMTKHFGTDHLYNADPFNEELPPSNSTEYLSSVGTTVLKSMTTSDPEAVWVMQGWFLYFMRHFWQPAQTAALLRPIPKEKLVVLDLFSEVQPMWNETSNFYDHVFIWNMLHNFGGRPGMYGVLPIVAHDPSFVLKNSKGLMQGIGLTMEAIEQNPIMYDLVTDMIWRNESVQLNKWVREYVHRRYGARLPAAELAWKFLQDSVYNCFTKQHGASASIIGALPSLNVTNVSSATVKIYWNPSDVLTAWHLLLSCAEHLKDVETYQYDIVDVTVQSLSTYALHAYSNFVDAYRKKNMPDFELWSNTFLSIADDMEQILASNRNFLLGVWTNSARSWGNNKEEQDLMEANARTQVTTWAPPSDGHLNDYSYKLWSGLVQDYQAKRWSMFINYLHESLESGKPFDPDNFEKEVELFEYSWTHATNSYPVTPTGNTIEISAALFDKYTH